MSEMQNAVFQDEAKAREWLEAHLWPHGPVCPHCGVTNEATRIEGKKHAHRDGLYMCNACRQQFTVTVGTIFERSHVPLNKWLHATFLLCASKKGISSHQLHRMLAVTYKTAWFMSHRIREAMATRDPGKMGGEGTTIEADETYFNPKVRRYRLDGSKKPGADKTKRKIVTLVERGGQARSFKVEFTDAPTIKKIIADNVAKGGALMTDEAGIYSGIGSKVVGHFAEHGTTMHSAGEYVKRDNPLVHSNTVENFFSVFKRGMRGTYQHCGEQHLQRYLAEFDFRYSNRSGLGVEDRERAAKALTGIVGKRLTYRRTRNAQPQA
jgi:transposase-like protein